MNGDCDDFGVPTELIGQVFTAQLKLRGEYCNSLRVGASLGSLLAIAKDACRHGDFHKWLERHFEGSARHARRLMQLAKSYPDPNTIPSLSLREALRLIAGGEGEEKTIRAQERLSGGTCTVILAAFPDVLRLIENCTIGPLELEGVTAQHPAMKAAKKIMADVRRLRGLVESLRTPEEMTAKQ